MQVFVRIFSRRITEMLCYAERKAQEGYDSEWL